MKISFLEWLRKLFGLKPRGRFIVAGFENDFLIAQSSTEVKFKPGVTVTEGKDERGNEVLFLRSSNGFLSKLQCRCPKGSAGGCSGSFKPGDAFALCFGTCKHVETGSPMACGWFLDEVVQGQGGKAKL